MKVIAKNSIAKGIIKFKDEAEISELDLHKLLQYFGSNSKFKEFFTLVK